MSVQTAWIVAPITYGISVLITTGYFIYKLCKCQNVQHFENRTERTISVSSGEIQWCMGWIWKLCLDKSTGQMSLSIFICWYIVSMLLELAASVALFFIIAYGFNSTY